MESRRVGIFRRGWGGEDMEERVWKVGRERGYEMERDYILVYHIIAGKSG